MPASIASEVAIHKLGLHRCLYFRMPTAFHLDDDPHDIRSSLDWARDKASHMKICALTGILGVANTFSSSNLYFP